MTNQGYFETDKYQLTENKVVYVDYILCEKVVDAIDRSFYKKIVLTDAIKHAKTLASQIDHYYRRPIDLGKTVATQAAQKACRIFHHKYRSVFQQISTPFFNPSFISYDA